ncbi:hypothetical protein ACU19_08000 [Actinobaculum suis]|nr:hypothetical protein ACU19_08000 [Actinobaculum suis]
MPGLPARCNERPQRTAATNGRNERPQRTAATSRNQAKHRAGTISGTGPVLLCFSISRARRRARGDWA